MARRRQPPQPPLLRQVVQDFSEHRLFVYATSGGFRAPLAPIPLSPLALAPLGALGLQGTWRKSIAPEIRPHVTPPGFHAIDYSGEKVLTSGTAPLIVF